MANTLAFLLFYVGVVGVCVLVGIIGWKSFTVAPDELESEPDPVAV